MDNELKYFINEEKKTVVCKATGCMYDLSKILNNKISSEKREMLLLFYSLYGTEDLLLEDSYVGKAKCSDEDEFDIEKGKKIARTKMREKYTLAKLNVLSNCVDKLVSFNEIMNEVIDKEIVRLDTTHHILYKFLTEDK